jgi:hypothetical protein
MCTRAVSVSILPVSFFSRRISWKAVGVKMHVGAAWNRADAMQPSAKILRRHFFSFRRYWKGHDISLLQPLHWPRIIGEATPLRSREAACADVVVVLTHAAVWILHLASQALETVP